MATELSVSDFLIYFDPIFSDETLYTNSRIAEQLSEAELEVTEVTYAVYYRRAAYYLTAHLLSLFVSTVIKAELAPGSSAMTSTIGMITSASVGDLSKAIETPEYSKADDKWYSSTRFGQEYLRLRNKMCKGGLIARNANVTGIY